MANLINEKNGTVHLAQNRPSGYECYSRCGWGPYTPTNKKLTCEKCKESARADGRLALNQTGNG